MRLRGGQKSAFAAHHLQTCAYLWRKKKQRNSDTTTAMLPPVCNRHRGERKSEIVSEIAEVKPLSAPLLLGLVGQGTCRPCF